MTSHKKNAYIHELIQKIQEGDKEAFGDIYSLFLDDIYKFVYFKVDIEDVSDLTENIFIKAWEKIHHYQASSNFRAWLFTIARNTVIDYYRTRKHPLSLNEAVEVADDLQSPATITEAKFNKALLKKAIAMLPDHYREIITLKFVNELSNEEIAQVTKKQQASIRILQFRGLKKLREILGKIGAHVL